jgi:pimeloyl-ACP methyl ester carboxylesterase
VTWELVDDILHEAHEARYVEVPGAAHALQVSHPILVADQIRRFALEVAVESSSAEG